ncbi:MAG: hypothetical protein KTV68_05910 [Acidimicrobiia bacterium]|nr:hypothetical protein [Acidimicrobiia bacterium]MCY4432540.1 hypothetical protein [bacterium]
MSGDVRVKVPAAPKYGRMAEIAAVHAATHQGFSSNEIGSLGQAIKEAVLLLLDPGQPNGSMEFDFQSKAGIVTVEAHVEQGESKPIPHNKIDRFESTAGSLVDSWKLDPDERRLWLQKSA